MSYVDPNEVNDLKPGPIAWMASNPVAANLLMIILIVGGLFFYNKTVREVFPEFEIGQISISMSYPGSSPEDIEQGIVLPIEDAIRDVDGIGEITSRASEGSGVVTAEVLDEDQMMRVLQDIKTATDQITTFPEDAENLKVAEVSRKRRVVELALYGTASETALRETAEQILDALESDSDIGSAELSGVRDYEIHVEVSQDDLRRYGLNIPDIASSIAKVSLELGGGSIDTSSGEVLVRLSERRDYASQFKDIPIITQENGSIVRLGDIASITEGFEDSKIYDSFDGKPAILIDTYRVGDDQTPVSVSNATMEQVEKFNATLPGDLKLSVLRDDSDLFKQRSQLLLSNGLSGLVLVVFFLALFLDIRLAFWVSLGIPVSFLGSFMLFPMSTDFSINMISMFAFIITLGIVVDDAIVVAENIYHKRQLGMKPLHAAVEGAREVALPVLVSVMTNMIAFIPLFFVPGFMGKIFSVIPVVVLAVFFISLIESLFILPSHLQFKPSEKMKKGLMLSLVNWQKRFSGRFEAFVRKRYGRFLHFVVTYRYVALAVFTSVLLIMGAYVLSGRVGMQLFPRIESDFSYAEAVLPVGSTDNAVSVVSERLLKAAQTVVAENGSDQLSEGIFTSVEENTIAVRIMLTDPDERPISTTDLTDLWRTKTGDIPGLESLTFSANKGGPGSDAALTIELSHRDTAILDKAAADLALSLEQFSNVRDIDDGSAKGKAQYDFTLTDLGYTLGLTPSTAGRQVRAAFYGAEAVKQQRGRNEVTVLVRLPEEERDSSYYLWNMMIRAPSGADVPLRDVVNVDEGRAFTTINRRDGRRVITVTADVDPPSDAGNVISTLEQDALPALLERYPGLSYSYQGAQADMRESLSSLMWGMGMIVFVMYALLAVLFSSYSQPIMVLIAIPFSMVGAVLGHFFMGYDLSVVSMFGIIALAGVVVNDSLILIDFANRRERAGENHMEAILAAGVQRFRPIMLTTLTTFVGLTPMILETSRQAQFLIPMAISLGFGILFATTLTLLLIPCLYMIIEDLKKIPGQIKARVIRLFPSLAHQN
ncbi:MAG: efflux RND transporter permease subunit [Alphaproteobacteria bacterium]|nr:efflux RND transporter permease subunit [Alphaproteobacteria bacterium]